MTQTQTDNQSLTLKEFSKILLTDGLFFGDLKLIVTNEPNGDGYKITVIDEDIHVFEDEQGEEIQEDMSSVNFASRTKCYTYRYFSKI